VIRKNHRPDFFGGYHGLFPLSLVDFSIGLKPMRFDDDQLLLRVPISNSPY
jgi:hypothetical protein